jgi:hypothetical protein
MENSDLKAQVGLENKEAAGKLMIVVIVQVKVGSIMIMGMKHINLSNI